MDVNTEKSVSYCILVVFLVVGVACYAGYPLEEPDEPIRVMFSSTAGSVLFDHTGHVSDSGYGIACVSCHHEDEDDPARCGECHDADADVIRVDAFHGQCKGCHEEEDAGPVKCAGCHVM